MNDTSQIMSAIADFSHIIETEPQSLEAQLGLGNAYQQMGWDELAIIHLQKALAIAPEQFLAEDHCRLGDRFKQRGKVAEAIACYEQGIRVNPDLVISWRSLVQIQVQTNAALDTILQTYKRANQHSEAIWEARDYNNLGVLWLRQSGLMAVNDQSALQEAIVCFQKAIMIDPTYADAHCNLGSAFLRQDQVKDAILAYKEAIDIDPQFAQAYLNLGIVLSNTGNIDEAIACLESVIELDPTSIQAREYLGKLSTYTK